MYQFEYTMDENDYFEFNKYHLFENPANKKRVLIRRLMVPLACVVIWLIFLLLGADFDTLSVLLFVYSVFSVMWFLSYKYSLIFSLRRNIKAMKKQGKLPYSNEVIIQFNEDCFIETTSATETRTKYTNVEKVVLGKSAVYVYMGAIQAYIVPFSVFETEKQKEEFCAFIENKRQCQ